MKSSEFNRKPKVTESPNGYEAAKVCPYKINIELKSKLS